MPNITKPSDLSNVWAATGDVVAPDTAYVANGWEAIIPPHEYFNWLDNRQDRFNAHVNQHGVPVWDANTEYQAGVSYTKGSDGVLYRAATTNSNVNPVGDTTGAWFAQNFGGIARYTTSGSFTVPVGVKTIYVSGCAGGGGGGSTLATNSTSYLTGGSGGGAGQSVIRTPINVTAGQVIPITIGVGGTGGTPTLDNAGNGNPTRLGTSGSILNLLGGTRGTRGTGGTAVPSNYGGPAGGAGYPNGGWASDTNVFTTTIASGGYGGDGASTPFGNAGPAGRGGYGSSSVGGVGFGYGAGGSGAGGAYASPGNAPGQSGGAGMPGLIIIEW